MKTETRRLVRIWAVIKSAIHATPKEVVSPRIRKRLLAMPFDVYEIIVYQAMLSLLRTTRICSGCICIQRRYMYIY